MQGHRILAWAWNGLFFTLLLALVAGLAFSRLLPDETTTQKDDLITAQTEDPVAHIAAGMLVPAGFTRAPGGGLLPRFAALARADVVVRMGPGENYPVAWVVRGGHVPVEVVAESGDWLRIRDHEGEEGWISRSTIGHQRLAMLAPWRKNARLALRGKPARSAPLTAWITPGVIVRVTLCNGRWCRIQVPKANTRGWVGQEQLWGVYAGEVFSASPSMRDAAMHTTR